MNHLPLRTADLKGASLACITGDPFRVASMAQEIGTESINLSHTREFALSLSMLENVPVVIASHGIGGPSLAILVEELSLLGIKEVVRVGTSGAIQPFIEKGDVVITTGSVRLDGVTTFYAPLSYPAVADPDWVQRLENAARKSGIRCHTGITASTDSFYPGQQRMDTKSRYIMPPWDKAMDMWRQLKVLNYEMESSALFVISSVLGIKAGCVTAVIVERDESEKISLDQDNSFQFAWSVAKSAIGKWITGQPSK